MEEEEAAAPVLRLEILRGPRQGESLEFRPGSAIRIGRVVKGNTLPIKDPGISSKHLSILTESNKWILRDLDSSNGTVLNGSQIPPHTPFTLHNNSTIKIGEVSSIHVTFIPHQHTLPPRRNPSRRCGRTKPVPHSPSEPVQEPVPPVANPGRGTGRGRGKGRVQIMRVDENDASVVHIESERVDLPARGTRNSNRVRVCYDLAEEDSVKEEPKSTRNPILIDISDSSVEGLSVPVVEKQKKSTRVTRNSKSVRGVSGNVECAVEENAEKKKSNDVTQKRKLEKEKEKENLNGDDENWPDSSVPVVEKLKKSTRAMPNSKDVRGVTRNVECGVEDNVTEKRELEKEGEDGKEKEKENGGDENWPDLSKMRLGEWFDFLEVYLPKQIMDETEEMIDSMRQKAERLREYIVEMQRQKDMARVEE